MLLTYLRADVGVQDGDEQTVLHDEALGQRVAADQRLQQDGRQAVRHVGAAVLAEESLDETGDRLHVVLAQSGRIQQTVSHTVSRSVGAMILCIYMF